MSVQTPVRYFKNTEEISNYIQDLFNNYGLDDLKPAGVRTEAPTTSTLGKGRMVIVELSGIPYIYYNSLGGVLYRKMMEAA